MLVCVPIYYSVLYHNSGTISLQTQCAVLASSKEFVFGKTMSDKIGTLRYQCVSSWFVHEEDDYKNSNSVKSRRKSKRQFACLIHMIDATVDEAFF